MKTTIGGTKYLLALAQAKMVICAFSLEVLAYGCLWVACCKGRPVLSQLKICPGFLARPFTPKVSSSRSKYFVIVSGFVAMGLA